MKIRSTLFIVIAILLIVSQLFGEGSTITSLVDENNTAFNKEDGSETSVLPTTTRQGARETATISSSDEFDDDEVPNGIDEEPALIQADDTGSPDPTRLEAMRGPVDQALPDGFSDPNLVEDTIDD